MNFGKKDKRLKRSNKLDIVDEQVKKVLTDTDQKLILMVRGQIKESAKQTDALSFFRGTLTLSAFENYKLPGKRSGCTSS